MATETKRKSNGRLYPIIGAVVVVVAVAVGGVAWMAGQKLSPDELAREWVISEIDGVGESTAAWMTGNNPILRELGGEWVEDEIHKVIKWEFSPAVRRPDGLYDVTASSLIQFDLPAGAGNVDAGTPWAMVIDYDVQTVQATPQWLSAYLKRPKSPTP